jgi:hypothetical protein
LPLLAAYRRRNRLPAGRCRRRQSVLPAQCTIRERRLDTHLEPRLRGRGLRRSRCRYRTPRSATSSRIVIKSKVQVIASVSTPILYPSTSVQMPRLNRRPRRSSVGGGRQKPEVLITQTADRRPRQVGKIARPKVGRFRGPLTAVARARTRSRIASWAASGIQIGVSSLARCSFASIKASRRSVLALARLHRNQRWCHHDAVVPQPGQQTVKSISTRTAS